jgi:hypothetical protein
MARVSHLLVAAAIVTTVATAPAAAAPRAAVLACPGDSLATAPAPPWAAAGLRTLKPAVDGVVYWPEARFSLRAQGGAFSFVGNGLPVGRPTGVFPPESRDDAAPYAGQSAAVRPHRITGRFRARPRRLARPACVDSDQPVAITLTGTPIMPAHAAGGLDLFSRQVQDACGGRTDSAGLYSYGAGSLCLAGRAPRRAHSPVVAYARDGHRVFGPRGVRGRRLRNRDLDRCHGHSHVVASPDGSRRRAYHYHLTGQAPYVLGCFRARPSRDWALVSQLDAPSPPPGEEPSPDPGTPGSPPGDSPPAADPGPTSLSVSADPGLTPAFDPAVTDYVTRCAAGRDVRLAVAAPDGTSVSVDGQPLRAGRFDAAVALDPDEAFSFVVATGSGLATHHVRCLPADFPAFAARRFGTPQAALYLVTPSVQLPATSVPYVTFFDARGVPLWWYRSSAASPPIDAALLDDDTLSWTRFPFDMVARNESHYEIHTLDGTLVREVRTVGSPTDFRDLQVLPNGNYLTDTYRPRDHVDLSAYGGPADATVQDAEIQELTPEGDLVWSWNSKDHIGLEEAARWYALPSGGIFSAPGRTSDGRTAYDIVHLNSLEADGDGIVFSARHLDAVYRIDRATGAIDWKVGGTQIPESLAIAGDPRAPDHLAGNHDARILADGSLTVHDNGTFLFRPPRALRFELDTVARTATLVEEVVAANVPVSFCCGSARRLGGGNWVMSWGSAALVTETTPAGSPVFELRFENIFSYRAFPIPPGRLSQSKLRAAMDVMHPR